MVKVIVKQICKNHKESFVEIDEDELTKGANLGIINANNIQMRRRKIANGKNNITILCSICGYTIYSGVKEIVIDPIKIENEILLG
jgi:hypothetical protein